MSTIKWSDLIVTGEDNQPGGTLGEWLSEPHYHESALASIRMRDGHIESWDSYFISAPGEEPEWDTPRVPVDWNGFEAALTTAKSATKETI